MFKLSNEFVNHPVQKEKKKTLAVPVSCETLKPEYEHLLYSEVKMMKILLRFS